MMMSPEKVNVLLAVAQRAPASLAEQIVCAEVAEWLIELVAAQEQAGRPGDQETRRPGDQEIGGPGDRGTRR
jgi:hypothetical protein